MHSSSSVPLSNCSLDVGNHPSNNNLSNSNDISDFHIATFLDSINSNEEMTFNVRKDPMPVLYCKCKHQRQLVNRKSNY